MSDEREEQQLDEAWRRASAADAGRPDAKLRAAILAEAAAASRRRTPAANESRFALRAVAGVAVVGLALLVWQQARHEVPREPAGSARVSEPRPQSQSSEAAEGLPKAADVAPTLEPVPGAGAPGIADAPGAANEPRVADAREWAPREVPPGPPAREPPPAVTASADQVAPAAEAPAPAEGGFAPPQGGAPAQAPRSAAPDDQRRVAERNRGAEADEESLSEVMVTGTLVTGQRAAPGPVISEAEAMELLRRHFPQQYQSRQPHRLWLVLDAAGRQFDSGELSGTQQLRDIEALVGRLAGAPNPWQVHILTNARGQDIELAIAHSRQ